MNKSLNSFDPAERMAQKMRMRQSDIDLLKSGRASQEDMRKKNFCLLGIDMSQVVVKDSYGNSFSV